MFTKRTDLAIEAHELWQESAGKTTRLAGVKATEKKIQGYPVTQVDILDREGEAALGKPAGSYRTLGLTAFWQRGDGFFDRAVRAVGQQVKELTPDSGPVLVVGLGNRAMTPDAVGPLAADSILITRHLIDAMPQHFSGFRPVAALRPGVSVFRGGIRGGCGAGSERAFRPGREICVFRRILSGTVSGWKPDRRGGRPRFPGVWSGRAEGRGVPVRWHSLKLSFGTRGEGLSGRLSGNGARCPDVARKLPGSEAGAPGRSVE